MWFSLLSLSDIGSQQGSIFCSGTYVDRCLRKRDEQAIQKPNVESGKPQWVAIRIRRCFEFAPQAST